MRPVVFAGLALATMAMLPPECQWPQSFFRPAVCETQNALEDRVTSGQTAINPSNPDEGDTGALAPDETAGLGKPNSGNGNGSEGSPIDPDPGNSARHNNGGD